MDRLNASNRTRAALKDSWQALRQQLSSLKRHCHRCRLVGRASGGWRKRYAKVYSLSPQYRAPVARSIEARHRALWRPLASRINLDTLRVCAGISGVADTRIVPEELFSSIIEGALNRWQEAGFLGHKSMYNRWFPDRRFPRSYVHSISSTLYDEYYHPIAPDAAVEKLRALDYPVVFKPSWGSYGGRGVFFPASYEELASHMRRGEQYTVQELVRQHHFFDQFNSSGLNTLRVCLYQSTSSGRTHVLSVALRMGVGGSLDNETAGGIVCHVDGSGRLNSYAVDKYGRKHFRHPDTNVIFAESRRLPSLPALYDLAIDTATAVLGARLISLDMFMDLDGNWRALEINLFGQTIRFAQYAGIPFFGDHTEEVIEYCRNTL